MVALVLALLMAITQPGGAGTTIMLYDDTNAANHAAAPGPHTWAEIATAFPADFISSGAITPQYRSAVNVQIGDAGVGTATTTLSDATDAAVAFTGATTLSFRNSQHTSWFLTLGTKVGSGNKASGINGGSLSTGAATNIRGTAKLYGFKLKMTTGAFNWNPGFASSGSEAINCLFQSSAGATAPFIFGAVGNNVSNLYNLDISHTTANQITTNYFVDAMERCSISGTAPLSFIQSGITQISHKDIVVFGTPTNADFRWATAGGTNWRFVRPQYSGNAPKFSSVGAITIAVVNATQELWFYNAKIVDRNGTGVPNIPVKLTDALGNIPVDALTDANGRFAFGSGTTAQAVAVMDHYVTAGTYIQRHRSPFYSEINTGINANPNYHSRTFYWDWLGSATVTTSSGSFEDVGDVIAIEDISGGGTSWAELTL